MKELGEHCNALVEKFDSTADKMMPLSDDSANTYRNLSGVWIAGGAFAVTKTIEWAEKTPISSKPALFLGTVAVTAIPSLVAGVLWRQSWRATGE